MRCSPRIAWLIMTALTSVGGSVAQAAAEKTAPDLAQRTFDMVAQSVEQLYYDPTLKGLDWATLTAQYRAGLAQKQTPASLHRHINELLALLNDSHTRLVPKVEAQSQADLPVSVGARGLRLAELRGEVFVREVVADSPAARAGIQRGDLIDTIGGESAAARFARNLPTRGAVPLPRAREAALARSLALRAGQPLMLGVRQDAKDVAATIVSVPDADTPAPKPALIETLNVDVAALRLRRFRNDVLSEVQRFLDAREPRGMILDLRGNDGGDLAVAMTVSERLFDKPVEFALERTRSDGVLPRYAEIRERAWIAGGKPNARDEPLAVLVDERCASACEVLAAALKIHGRARVFGHGTAGIVAGITARPIELPDGSGLNISRMGILGPNRTVLDNVGVSPDESCEITPADLRQGIDCVERLAVKWLGTQIAY